MSEWKDITKEEPPRMDTYWVKCVTGDYRADFWRKGDGGEWGWEWYNITHWKEIDPVPEPKPEPVPSTFTWNYILPTGWSYKVDGGKKIILNGDEVVAWAWEGDSDQSLLESVIYECSQEIHDLAKRLEQVHSELGNAANMVQNAMEKCYS